MKPGLYPDIEHGRYQAGLTAEPALTSGTVHRIVNQSPLHAWAAHPQLNPNFEREEDSRLDLGSAAHALLLEGNLHIMEVIDAPDWRTKAAKEARDAARAAGKIPVLPHQQRKIQAMTQEAWRYLDRSEIGPALSTFEPEVTMIWTENGATCKGRPDWLASNRLWQVDFKTCDRASPDTVIRIATNMGYFTQAAFYRRGVKALTGIEPKCVIFAQEIEPPYACSLVGLPPALLAHEDAKIDYAIEIWNECLKTGEWPAYSTRIAWAELPPWESIKWQERMSMEAMEAEGA